MTKILIIGQAPPAIVQTLPYDTTMLYDILAWVGVSKQQAQEMFEFEAVSNKFPGHGKSGHKKPSDIDMIKHWNNTLEAKVQAADRIWILGNVARDFFNIQPKRYSCNTDIYFMIHPSKRNYDRIMQMKGEITKKLSKFLCINSIQ